eukprot:448133_1
MSKYVNPTAYCKLNHEDDQVITLNAACKRAAMECGHLPITQQQSRLQRYQNTGIKSKKPKYEFKAMDDESVVFPKQFWLFHDPNNDMRLCKILQIFHVYKSGTVPMRFNSKNDKCGFLLIQILVPHKIQSSNDEIVAPNVDSNIFADISDNDDIPFNFTMQLEDPIVEMSDINNTVLQDSKMDVESENNQNTIIDAYEFKD